jgi:hypothetical protein
MTTPNRGLGALKSPVFPLVAAQAVVYLLVAPALVVWLDDPGARRGYATVQIEQLVFFLIPFFAIYLALATPRARSHIVAVEVSAKRMLFLSAAFLAYDITYWVTVARLDLFTRRLGTDVIAELFGQLSLHELFVLRFHDTTVFLFPALFLVIALRATDRHIRRIGKFLLTVAVASLLVHTLLNSRLQLVVGAFALAVVFMRLRPPLGRRVLVKAGSTFVLVTLLLMASTYAIRENRDWFGAAGPDDAAADRLERLGDPSHMANEWIKRLDCVDLVNTIKPSLSRSGFAKGEAWRVPFYMLFGAFLDSEEYAAVKAEGLTTAKAWLLDRHTMIGLRDYYSCALTDAFGNFGYFGYLLAAFYFAIVILVAERLLYSARPNALLLGIALLVHVVVFEAELFTQLFGWLKFAPAVVALMFLNPIRSMKLSTAPETKAASDTSVRADPSPGTPSMSPGAD